MNLKKITLFFFIALLISGNISAKDVNYSQYDLTFKGRGESEKVENVTVENLTQGTSLSLSGSDTLRLTSIPTGTETIYISKIKPKLYPNPAISSSLLDFVTISSGKVSIKIADLSGKTMNMASFYLQSGEHSVVIPALNSGIYIVSIQGGGVSESMRWMCMSTGSSGSIQLNGMPSTTMQLTKSKLKKVASTDNVEEMYYVAGDLLRFTGTNGDMTTIVMNQPTCDHDITFDFYDCTDATGRHYPIVNVGGVLWMTEDLGMVSSKVAVRSSTSAWKDYPKDQAKATYYEFEAGNTSQGAYYNIVGAKAALPAGWQLPTAGEVDYMLNNLGGYDKAALLLKGRKKGAWGIIPDGLDSISFGAGASGIVTSEGNFTGMDFKVNYWTRSTKKSIPMYWGIENNTINFSADQTADAGNGFRVRGVRPAPSVYNDVIEALFANNTQKSSKVSSATNLFESGPLGGSYTVTSENQKLFTDYSYMYGYDPKNPTSDNKAFSCYNYTAGKYTRALIGKGVGISPYLKKATAQNNENGRQNMVVAIWNRPLKLWNESNGIRGEGTISLVIYGDSTQNYARIDSITLPDEFEMDFPIEAIPTSQKTGETAFNAFCSSYVNQTFEECSSRFYILSADFNDDGIGDFVVGCNKKVVVYNGANYSKMYEKTFAPYGKNNVRLAVGDVDGDHKPDIAAIYSYGSELMMRIEVYPGGNLSINPSIFNNFTFTTTDNSSKTFEDIKIGNVAGHGVNNIVAMATGNYDPPQIYVFEYNSNEAGYLKQIAALKSSVDNEVNIFNYNVSLVLSRGSTYPAYIVTGPYFLRYVDKQDGSGTLSGINSNYLNNTFLHADNIVAGNFDNNQEGKEQISGLFMKKSIEINKTANTIAIRNTVEPNIKQLSSSGALQSTLLSSPGIKYMYAKFNITHFGQFIKYYNLKSYNEETMQVPVIGAARSVEPGRVLKYVGHTSTLSEPRIYALLAAPPYYKYKADGITPYQYEYDMGTSWGKSTVSGSSTANESSHEASAIFGYEQDFNIPIIGTKIGSIDFTTKLGFEWSHSTEIETQITKSNTFTTKNNDAVILLANFYDTYTYEIIKSGNSDDIGSKLTISLPKDSRMMMITLDDYERLTADNRGVPNLRKAFIHKVGYPFTYPDSKSQIQHRFNTPVFWGGSMNGNEFIGIGSSGNLNRSISLDQSTASTSGFTFNMDMELVGTAFGIKAGGGYGYSHTNSSTHTEGEGHTIEGTVAGLRTLSESGLSDFKWNVCWYQKNIGGQTFPVVYYVVQP